MKILRKGDDFKKMPERNMDDVNVIVNLVKQGWNYCSKSVYKNFFNSNEDLKKPELKPEKKKNGEKEIKSQNKPEKKKIERKSKTDKKKSKK